METKQEFRYFTITEYDKEQEYLSRRHREGWKFVEAILLKCQKWRFG